MSFLSSGVAVVTGAGSGIGRALAQQLAVAGSALAIADIDEKGLTETAASLTSKTAAVSTHVLDVSKEEAVRSFAEDVAARHGRVTLLINNAGVALIGTFEEISLDDLRWVMGINFWGVVYGVKYFLPVLEAAAARADCEFVERVWDNCSGRGRALIRRANLPCAGLRSPLGTNWKELRSLCRAFIQGEFARRSRSVRGWEQMLRETSRKRPSRDLSD